MNGMGQDFRFVQGMTFTVILDTTNIAYDNLSATVVQSNEDSTLIVRNPTVKGVPVDLNNIKLIRYGLDDKKICEHSAKYISSLSKGDNKYTLLKLFAATYVNQNRNAYRIEHSQQVSLKYSYVEDKSLDYITVETTVSMKDISCGGMKIASSREFKKGTELSLTFEVGPNEKLTLQATVIHIWEVDEKQTGKDNKQFNYHIGVQFIKTDTKLMDRLSKYIADIQVLYLRRRAGTGKGR